MEKVKAGKIGIAITTQNRREIFSKTYEQIKALMPPGAYLYIVDDGSKEPLEIANFRFNVPAGIAKAKNKCIEGLMRAGCEHFFLFDDDCYPLAVSWYKYYIENQEPHLMYIFENWGDGSRVGDCEKIYSDYEIVAYTKSRGCMLYFTREVIEIVGGFHEDFGRWGWEHVNFSDRVYKAGLTKFRYQDANTRGRIMFYSVDQYTKNEFSTVSGNERNKALEHSVKTYHILDKEENVFFPFAKNWRPYTYLTIYITGVSDPQRETKWDSNIFDLEVLAKSVNDTLGRLVVFYNNLKDEDIKKFKELHPCVSFIKVAENNLNVYFYRWVLYYDYLRRNKINGFVACVDGTDVEILKNPGSEWLFTGCEEASINNQWLWLNHNHYKMGLFMRDYGGYQMLNAGVLGGDPEAVREYIRNIIDIYGEAPTDNKTDMLAFNMAAYRFGRENIAYGDHVTTTFKGYEYDNKKAWIRHK